MPKSASKGGGPGDLMSQGNGISNPNALDKDEENELVQYSMYAFAGLIDTSLAFFI